MTLITFKPTYKPFGAYAILVEWPQVINTSILKDIINFNEKIRKFDIESLVEIKSSYCSLLIIYNDLYKGFDSETMLIDKIYGSDDTSFKTESILWKIPVCYDAYFGVDLEIVSEEKGMAKEELVKLHSNVFYTVYFIGFLPGFLYLGGLDEKLHFPRKSTPRLQIKKGSVAIGGNQTGVYPSESPGGWNIIGNSPINFFDVNKENPCFAKPGDSILFYPVSLKEHERIKRSVDENSFELESEVIND